MTARYSTRMGELVRPDTLKCTRCWRWLSDAHFPERVGKEDRRGRGVTCELCCDRQKARRSGRTTFADEIEVENVTRTADQMGRAVPIFATWSTKVRES